MSKKNNTQRLILSGAGAGPVQGAPQPAAPPSAAVEPAPAPQPAPGTPLAPRTAHRLADTFRLLGDSTRLRIVFACLDGPVSVGQIAAALEQSPSLVSHHLRLLRAARVVDSRREGKQVFYWAADEHIRSVLRDMATHVEEPLAHEEAG